MKLYRKTIKMFQLAIMLTGYFLVRNLFWHKDVLKEQLLSGHTKEEVLKNFLLTGNFGTEEVVLIGTLILVLSVEFLADKEEFIYMLRYPDRISYLQRRCLQVFVAALLVSLIRILCSFCYFLKDFGSELIFSEQIGRFVFWYIVITLLYGGRCGIIYMILRDLLNKKNATIGITMLIYFMIYYIYLSQWLYPIIRRDISWVPFCDIDAPGAVYAGIVEKTENYICAIRQLIMTAGAYTLWFCLWNKKDVIRLEK